MKRGNLEKWSDISTCNNLLFFSQLVNELLFDYSIPSNRISTLNSHYLCLDALSAIEGIDDHGVPEGTLKPIMEELYSVFWSIKVVIVLLHFMQLLTEATLHCKYEA